MKSFNSIVRSVLGLTFIILLVALPASTAFAYADGPRNPGEGVNVSGIGTVVWTNPGNIVDPSDTNYSTITLSHANPASNYLQARTYGFAIPTGATITGIEVLINRMGDPTTQGIRDAVVSLAKADTMVGQNKAVTNLKWPDVFTSATYGGPNDLWGTTWAPADFNDLRVDFAVSTPPGSPSLSRLGTVKHIQVTVYYMFGTSTAISCNSDSVTYGESITCEASVTGTAGTLTPTGSVNWTTDGSGTFNPNPCTLSGTGAFATCSVTYTPDQVGSGSHLLTAAYAGDTTFTSSSDDQLVTVLPKAASVTPDTASKTYGDVDPTLTGTLAGFLESDGVTATYSRTPGETVLDSPFAISAVLSPTTVLSNYAITYNTANFTINPKAASVTPDLANKTYGDVDPTFTGTLSGFLDADVVTASYSRSPGETVLGNPYTISAVLSPTTVLSNYAITYNTANFTINPKAASVTPDAASKAYGAVDPTFTGTLVGFLEADLVTATYTRTPGETILGNPYSISAGLSPTSALSNYAITYNTAHFTITGNVILMPLVQR